VVVFILFQVKNFAKKKHNLADLYYRGKEAKSGIISANLGALRLALKLC
jgi:hypothetical protein